MSPASFRPEDPAALEAMAADGVVCLRGAIAPDWLERLDAAVEAAVAAPGPHHFRFGSPDEPGFFFGDVLLWQRLAAFRDFAFEGPLAALAGRLMGSESVVFYHDFLLVKQGGTPRRTPWHQDQSYWCVGGDQALTIWAPLDPVGRANTLEFLRGSHRWAPLYAAVPFGAESRFDGGRDGRPPVPDIEAERDRHEILAWELAPGDCLAFHCRMLHSAPGNPLHRPRRALSTCWAGDDARFVAIASDLAPPVVGEGLRHGDPLACATFPRILPRPAA